MHSLSREIHREIIVRLEPEVQQIVRLTDRYFAGLIQPQDVNLLDFGAKHNLLEYCEIGLSRGDPKGQICRIAALNGHLEILRWARSQGCPWDEITCTWAAQKGHLEVLKWARSQGCPWSSWTCTWAAEYGHLETLKWVRKHGCPWGSDTCSLAANSGHLEVLQWLRSQGCPWNENVCVWAARNGHLEVVKWANDNGCIWNYWCDDITTYTTRVQEYVKFLRCQDDSD
jgi:hypothetical protein